MNENDVSWNKCKIHSQFHHGSKHSGVNTIGRIVALTQMIHNVLKIFDHTKFATHISYFFFMIAVIVVANSGKLVHAAIIVAPMAHSDIHKVWAINTAQSTITSEAITKSQILATNFVIFKSIHFEVSLAHGILLLNTMIINNNNSIAMKISLTESISKWTRNLQEVISMFMNASNATPKNRYKKFLTLGMETSIASSVGDSFLMIKYALYPINRAKRLIHSHVATCWSRNIMKIRAVTNNRNAQSLWTNFFWIITGAAIADIQRIIHKLNMFDQIMFHIDNDPLHCTAAIHDKNNSGAEVHIARIVNQIRRSDTLKCFAILTLVLIRLFAEKTNKYNQITNTIHARIMFL